MKMNEYETTNRTATILSALLVSATLSMLVGSRPARGATSCMWGETVDMTNPVVVVIDGQGDVAAEQAQWSALEYAGIRGGLEMGLGERTWALEHAP